LHRQVRVQVRVLQDLQGLQDLLGLQVPEPAELSVIRHNRPA